MELSRNRLPYWLLLIGLLIGVAAAPPRQDDATPTPPDATPTDAAPPTEGSEPVTTEPATPFVPPVWVSPTPDETGAIIVIVQPGDSMWVIAARAGISLPELLALNGLTEESIITPGDALIVGYVTPEFTAPEPITPTATLLPPTPRPTATPSEAAVCLSAFDDLDRNGIHDEGEPLRSGVAFTIYNTRAVVANYITDGRSEPKCLGGLTPGEYRITRSVVPGEILTTSGDWTLTLTAGSELRQAFGSYLGGAQTATPAVAAGSTPEAAVSPVAPSGSMVTPESGSGSALLPRLVGVAILFLGGLLLLGAVLILLIRQSRNPSPSHSPADSDERRFRNIDDLE